MARSVASSVIIEKHGMPIEGLTISGNNCASRKPKKRSMAKEPRAIDDDDLDEDETISERLAGLSEMFPDSVRKTCSQARCCLVGATKGGCWFVRNALWVVCSSAVILALPVIFESERARQLEAELQQQRQILLGPNAAVSGSQSSNNLLPGMGMMPPIK